jgi:hypothetical protein
MKKTPFIKLVIVAILATLGSSLSAQTDTTFILNPADLTPSDTGYYLAGIDKTENGSTVHYSECYDAYGDASFMENGLQQGFTYHKCMIMPSCTAKGTSTVDDGFIGIGKGKYFDTDSAVVCWIMSPSLSNLDSLYIQTSSDISINTSRHVPFYIQYSTDDGITWNTDYWIMDYVTVQGGYTVTYTSSGSLNFSQMVTDSKTQNIRLRIRTGDNTSTTLGSDKGQRVFVHKIKIYAKTVINTTTGISTVTAATSLATITDRTITSKEGNIIVYTQLGQVVGTGTSVTVKNSGLYIIKNAAGSVQKVFIN